MNKYCVKHKRQTLEDFTKDCHRFSFWYGGKEMEASCYGAITVFFNDESIPEDVQCEVQDYIYELIDEYGYKWAIPKGARKIVDAYCQENFS